jgi:hypothetical protein
VTCSPKIGPSDMLVSSKEKEDTSDEAQALFRGADHPYSSGGRAWRSQHLKSSHFRGRNSVNVGHSD